MIFIVKTPNKTKTLVTLLYYISIGVFCSFTFMILSFHRDNEQKAFDKQKHVFYTMVFVTIKVSLPHNKSNNT